MTAHPISKKVCEAFAKGCDGRIVPPVILLPGVAAMYGILRGTSDMIKECEKIKRDYFYIDLGYFERSIHYRGDYSGYYRVSKNLNQSAGSGNSGMERWNSLNIKMKPWRSGEYIVICPLSKNVGTFLGISPQDWLKQTVEEIIKHTDKPITIKPKDSDQSLKMTLANAHCIVAYNSNALVDAVLEGVPVFYTGPSCVAPVGLSDLSKIDNPITPDREQWAANLAASQWTLEEMNSGLCWKDLNEID